jgi:hypothetical protein
MNNLRHMVLTFTKGFIGSSFIITASILLWFLISAI